MKKKIIVTRSPHKTFTIFLCVHIRVGFPIRLWSSLFYFGFVFIHFCWVNLTQQYKKSLEIKTSLETIETILCSLTVHWKLYFMDLNILKMHRNRVQYCDALQHNVNHFIQIRVHGSNDIIDSHRSLRNINSYIRCLVTLDGTRK